MIKRSFFRMSGSVRKAFSVKELWRFFGEGVAMSMAIENREDSL
jgi:hypothetical protein